MLGMGNGSWLIHGGALGWQSPATATWPWLWLLMASGLWLWPAAAWGASVAIPGEGGEAPFAGLRAVVDSGAPRVVLASPAQPLPKGTPARVDPQAWRTRALAQTRIVQVREPQGAAPGRAGTHPWSTGESNGFGHGLAWVGSDLWVTSPRSFLHAERAGALWWGNPAEAGDGGLTVLRDHPHRPWQALGIALRVSPPFANGRRWIAVGAPLAPGDGWDPGHVELFTQDSGRPRWQQTLVPARPSQAGGFGTELLWQGRSLWVGAPFAAGPGGALQAGRISRWDWDGSVFKRRVQRYGPSAVPGERFGEALAVHGDRLFVGSPGAGGRGALVILDASTEDLPVLQVLQVSSPEFAEAHFGADVAVTSDGEWLFVGAPNQGVSHQVGAVQGSSGAVVVFRRDSRGLYRLSEVWRDMWDLGVPGFGQRIEWVAGQVWIGAPRGVGAVWRVPAPWDRPTVQVAWLGRTRRAALGQAIVGAEDPAHAGQVWVSAAGQNVASQEPPPQGVLYALPSGAQGHRNIGKGQGLRWAGDVSTGGVLRAWGLRPFERVGWRWVGAEGSRQTLRADERGQIFVLTGPPPALPQAPTTAPPQAPTAAVYKNHTAGLELRRSHQRAWRMEVRLP